MSAFVTRRAACRREGGRSGVPAVDGPGIAAHRWSSRRRTLEVPIGEGNDFTVEHVHGPVRRRLRSARRRQGWQMTLTGTSTRRSDVDGAEAAVSATTDVFETCSMARTVEVFAALIDVDLGVAAGGRVGEEPMRSFDHEHRRMLNGDQPPRSDERSSPRGARCPRNAREHQERSGVVSTSVEGPR